MKIRQLYFVLIHFFLISATPEANAQLASKGFKIDPLTLQKTDLKLYTRSYGMIIGIQRGKFTFLELGVEKHWTKVKLIHQKTYSLGANMEYNFKNNVLGYKISGWRKSGRINLTYGFNLSYFTNFNESRYGLGPAIGFRLLGFHLVNGYNFTIGDSEFKNFNKLFVSIRYFFPLEKKFKLKRKS